MASLTGIVDDGTLGNTIGAAVATGRNTGVFFTGSTTACCLGGAGPFTFGLVNILY
jgi:hypothetical protein